MKYNTKSIVSSTLIISALIFLLIMYIINNIVKISTKREENVENRVVVISNEIY